MNTIIFDVEGVVSYPGFDERIIKPLEDLGTNMLFWTYSPQVNGFKRLSQYGLDRYAIPGKCIGDELYTALRQGVNGLELAHVLQQAGLPHDEVSLNRVTSRYAQYETLREKLHIRVGCKFPPILGDNSYLLFESDCSLFDASNWYSQLTIEDTFPDADKKLAREAGYSVIIVPEHPDVWLAGEKKILPEIVRQKIAARAFTWKGEQIVEDLREHIGIYQEGRQRGIERW